MAAITWHDAGLTSFDLPEADGAQLEARLARRQRSQLAMEVPDWVAAVVSRAQAHFDGRLQDFTDVALDWAQVGAFQRDVYRATQAIRAGSTRSYGEIAQALGLPPASARAVGAALGSNPWPLLVPCHRVVAASGKMTGFSAPGGIAVKTRLLSIEGAELPLA